MAALSTLTLMLFFITKNISVIVLFQFVIFIYPCRYGVNSTLPLVVCQDLLPPINKIDNFS